MRCLNSQCDLGSTCLQHLSVFCSHWVCLAQVQLPRPAQALYRVIGNPSVRLSAVLALALVAVWGMHASNASQDADLSSMLEVCAAHLRSPFLSPESSLPITGRPILHHALVCLSAVLELALVAVGHTCSRSYCLLSLPPC